MNTVLKLSDGQKNTKVRILDDTVVNQIAAGEVVERPSSVVKELIENAIDAGATAITVVADNGGHTNIEVIDDGCGMTKDDALVAIQRFGTSKIAHPNDLQSIATLGFRGEALPSIASVSRFSLETCVHDSAAKYGVVIDIAGGRTVEITDRPLPAGTRVRVQQLFFNVPARKRFLKTEKTELGLIKTLVQDFALCVPQVRLKLIADGAGSLNFAPSEHFLSRAEELKLGGAKPITVKHVAVASGKEIRVDALLSEPLEVAPTSNRLRFIVNGRIVRDRLLLAAVRQGYGNFLKGGRYPIGVVRLELSPSEIDVNVHPQKAEVRFRNTDAVFSAIVVAIRKTFEKKLDPAQIPVVEERPEVVWTAPAGQFESQAQMHLLSHSLDASAISGPDRAGPSRSGVVASGVQELRYLGQIFSCYLLFASGEKFVVVDMHAGHERVVFYRLKKQLQSGKVASQLLLVPEVVELPANQVAKLIENQDRLARLGIELELFGESSVLVRAMPGLIKTSPKKIFDDLFSLGEWSDWDSHLGSRCDDAIARIACHGSIRSGRELEREEAYELMRSLDEAECSGLCPHGRPIVKEYTLAQVEAMFGRS